MMLRIVRIMNRCAASLTVDCTGSMIGFSGTAQPFRLRISSFLEENLLPPLPPLWLLPHLGRILR
jgi:hypothetical protein